MNIGAIAIESTGTGSPVLFIHGLGGTSNVFGPQVGVLSRFFACHRFDLPGAGRSPSKETATIDALVSSALSVLDSLGLGVPVHIIGHSMGTIVAQHLAAKAPDRVQSLALIGPIHAPSPAARAAFRDRAAKVRAEGMASIADQVVAAGTSAETKAARPEIAAFVRELILRQESEGYAEHCEAISVAVAADLTGIEVPVLLITGDEDNTSPVPASVTMASALPDATLEILARTGHWATLERPDEVSQLLVAFLFGRGRAP